MARCPNRMHFRILTPKYYIIKSLLPSPSSDYEHTPGIASVPFYTAGRPENATLAKPVIAIHIPFVMFMRKQN